MKNEKIQRQEANLQTGKTLFITSVVKWSERQVEFENIIWAYDENPYVCNNFVQVSASYVKFQTAS